MRGLVALYAGPLAFVTVLNVASGIFFIYQLFHGAGDAQVQKCVADAQSGAQDVNHWVCSEGFAVARDVVVAVYVVFWLVEICASLSLSVLPPSAVAFQIG